MPARPSAPSPLVLSQTTALPNGEGQWGKLHRPIRCHSPAENKAKQQAEGGWWRSRCGTMSPGSLRLPCAGSMEWDGQRDWVSQGNAPL